MEIPTLDALLADYAAWNTRFPDSGPLAPTRPYGGVWAYYPDKMHPSMRYVFEYVSANFTQALHMALLCWLVWRDRREQRGIDAHEADLRDALLTLDPTIHAEPYWQGWIEWALEEA